MWWRQGSRLKSLTTFAASPAFILFYPLHGIERHIWTSLCIICQIFIWPEMCSSFEFRSGSGDVTDFAMRPLTHEQGNRQPLWGTWLHQRDAVSVLSYNRSLYYWTRLIIAPSTWYLREFNSPQRSWIDIHCSLAYIWTIKKFLPCTFRE